MFKFGRTGLVFLPVMVLLALVTSQAIAFPVDSEQDGNQVFRYTVQPGDSFWNISQRFAVDATDLASQNAMTTSEALQVGVQLAIPKHNQDRLHRVKSGENLWSIANQYGIPVSSLAKTNNVQDPNVLRIGQILTLPVAQARVSRGGINPVTEKSVASFQWPLSGTITSRYGWRKGEFHDGLDLAAEKGTEIAAVRGGTVVFAGWSYGYGQAVKIDHGDGYSTLYAHTSKMLVEVGERVTTGQVIALVGSTGRSTGPHLHFEVRYAGKTLDPLNYLGDTAVAADI